MCFPCVVSIETAEVGLIERNGKFHRLAPPGLNVYLWPWEKVKGSVSFRIQQVDVDCHNSFPQSVSSNIYLIQDFVISIQYQALREKVREAYYNNPGEVVSHSIASKVRQHVSHLVGNLESTNEFEFRGDLSRELKVILSRELSGNGYCIVDVAVNKADGRDKLRPDMEMASTLQQQMIRTTPQSTPVPLNTDPGNFQDCCCLQHVAEQQVGVVEDLGQFSRVLDEPGWHCVCWPVVQVVGRLSLLPQNQNNIICDAGTVDHAVIRITVSVQFHVRKESAYEAFYRLVSPGEHIRQSVEVEVRSRFSKMTESEILVNGEEHGKALFDRLVYEMKDFGYEISSVVIDDLATMVPPSTQLPCSENPNYKPPVQLSMADELLQGQFEPRNALGR